MGLVMGVLSDNSPIQVINGREVPQAPLREQVRLGFKSLGNSFILLPIRFIAVR